MSDAPAAAADAKPETKSSKGGLTTVFLALNSVLLIAVLAVMLLKKPDAAAAAPAKGAEHAEAESGGEGEGGHEGAAPQTLRLPDMVIHLRNPDVDRYARISFEIDVTSEKDKETVTAQLPRIREAILSYLSDRTVDDLRGSEGIEKIKEALSPRLATLIPSSRPRHMYITDLVIQ